MQYPQYTKPISEAEQEEFIPFLQTLVQSALAVIIPNFLAGIQVDEKSNHTPVTKADRGAEGAMRKMIEDKYPHHGVYG